MSYNTNKKVILPPHYSVCKSVALLYLLSYIARHLLECFFLAFFFIAFCLFFWAIFRIGCISHICFISCNCLIGYKVLFARFFCAKHENAIVMSVVYCSSNNINSPQYFASTNKYQTTNSK